MGFPNLSLVKIAPFAIPLFPFPLASLAFPLKGYQATRPFTGRYPGTIMKLLKLVPVSDPTVTVIFPVVASEGTVEVILVAVLAVTVAVTPLNFTMLLIGIELKFVPAIVTDVPAGPLVGVNDVIMGVACTKENPTFVAAPPGVVTDTLPVVPAATTAVTLVGETTVNDVAAVPPKLTAVAPVRFVPVIVTVAPVPALVGVNDVITGAGTKVNPVFVAVPPGVVTDTLPDELSAITAVIIVGETTVNDVAGVPPKLTAFAPVKLAPVIVIVDPTPAAIGENEEIIRSAPLS